MLFESVQQFVVAETADGELIGCGALHVMWEDLGEIRTLIVRTSGCTTASAARSSRPWSGTRGVLGLSPALLPDVRGRLLHPARLHPDRRAGRRPGRLLAAAAQPRRGHRGVPRPRARQAEHARQHPDAQALAPVVTPAAPSPASAAGCGAPRARLRGRPLRPPRAGCRPRRLGRRDVVRPRRRERLDARLPPLPHAPQHRPERGRGGAADHEPVAPQRLLGSPGAGATAIWWSQTSSAASGPVSGMPLSRKMRTGPRRSVVKRSLAWMSWPPERQRARRRSCRRRHPRRTPTGSGSPPHRGAPSRGRARRAPPPPAASAGPATRHPHRSRSRT